MQTETLRQWISKSHGSRLCVVDPEEPRLASHVGIRWLELHMVDKGEYVSFAYDYTMLTLIEDTYTDKRWRKILASLIHEMRNETRKQRGQGELLA